MSLNDDRFKRLSSSITKFSIVLEEQQTTLSALNAGQLNHVLHDLDELLDRSQRLTLKLQSQSKFTKLRNTTENKRAVEALRLEIEEARITVIVGFSPRSRLAEQSTAASPNLGNSVSRSDDGCEICGRSFFCPSFTFSEISSFTCITHVYRVCTTCWSQYFKRMIRIEKTVKIGCPGFDCSKDLSAGQIQQFTDESTYIAWKRLRDAQSKSHRSSTLSAPSRSGAELAPAQVVATASNSKAEAPGLCDKCAQMKVSFISLGSKTTIKCPIVECKAILSRDDIKRLASDFAYAKWKQLVEINARNRTYECALHSPYICTDCWNYYLGIEITALGRTDVKCPIVKCRITLSGRDMKSNSHGQLGHGTNEDTSIFTPSSLPSSAGRPRRLVFGGTHTLALTEKGLYVAGNNAKGQLGLAAASTPRADTQDEQTRLRFELLPLDLLLEALDEVQRKAEGWYIADVAATWETSFVVLRRGQQGKSNDALLTFGANDWDEWANGVGNEVDGKKKRIGRISFDHLVQEDERVRIRRLEAGPRHVVAELQLVSPTTNCSRTSLVGWGASRHGQLGFSETSQHPRTISIPSVLALPPPFAYDAGGSSLILDFAVGRDHTAIFLASTRSSSPTLILLGSSKQGQLGAPSSHPSNSPSCNSLGILNEDYGLINLDGTPLPPPMRLQASWSGTYIYAPSPSPLRILAFGSNTHSQLALPSSTLRSSSKITSILIPTLTGTKTLSTGSEHVLLLITGEVFAWGWNEHGNLGDGSLVDGETAKMVWSEEGAVVGGARGRASAVWGGNATSWVWVEEGEELSVD
ncbi:regulator of chromosome condensation 1/beta-lactamase-inhibitor protein II [Leucosporidium creatinivorum]|uniref:Regulator of chromosome condensation 1/beta-lactamase-inhibitor protein II n=1 Tax=Leucosporidium creatinivorum TaxID=106004 RepID=A0A1Y2E6G8_9BASI|nr:regulator of chromosome condensation 1/beta-lactamase-inhibitor protein II [Leucosporidium creatinivorum]